MADVFVDLATASFADSSAHIEQDGCHILLDMQAHTRGECSRLHRCGLPWLTSAVRVCAHLRLPLGTRPAILVPRPAPIQVNYLVYPGSMGADYVDYIVVDRTVVPPEHACKIHCPHSVLALLPPSPHD